MTSALRHVTVDCADPHALASWWAQALGGRLSRHDSPGDPEAEVLARGTALLFVQVPERKTVKNRLHLDLQPDGPRDAEVDRLMGLGATLLGDRRQPDGTGWAVLADPEGNELCVLRSAAERGSPRSDTGDRPYPSGVRTASERELLLGLLDWYRDGVLRKVAGLDQDLAVRRAGPSATTVAGLVKHLALVEDTWFTERAAGRPLPEPWAGVDWDADPDWEFRTAQDEPLEASVALYERAVARSRAVVQGRDLDEQTTDERGRTSSLRFTVAHLLEETARHLGHLDVLRELADGATGE